MRDKIFRSMCLLTILAVLLSSISIFVIMYGQTYHEMKQKIRTEAAYIRSGMAAGGEEYLADIRSRINSAELNRITLIDPKGAVLYDNYSPAAAMENHGDRPEVRMALAEGWGEDTRFSSTISRQTFYYAVLLEDGNVLRIAGTSDTALRALKRYIPYALLTVVLMAALAFLAARRQTRKIVEPINHLNLEEPLNNEIYDEFSPLLSRVAKQQEQIQRHIEELEDKRREFTTITRNMREGLILLDYRAFILSMNPSAMTLFGVDAELEALLGKHILTVNRSVELQHAVEQGEKGMFGEALVSRHGRSYQILANPVLAEDSEQDIAFGQAAGEVTGIVVLILDVTERQEAEQMRKEFSANVSHELKTPLQSISGYAEIIQNGLVKPEDIVPFAGKIHSEARRLITLVEDIIQLSRLDEAQGKLPETEVDLLEVVRDVVSKLEPAAKERNIVIHTEGETTHIIGAPQVLWEMIYNLCDNAIKYNKEGGRADVRIVQEKDAIILAVSDTGIGIPFADRERVFERFYRVDKSHSRETGGTGLGLSIVKHGAKLHNAKVVLESKEGEGTTVRITFKK